MTSETAKRELEHRIRESGTPMNKLTPEQGVRLMLDFYGEVRADDCELDADGDMLLFQWGCFDFGERRTFWFNMTRQFIAVLPEEADDETEMSQLSLTFHFPASDNLEALKGNRWCGTPDELEDFQAFIIGGEAFGAIAASNPRKVTLEYGRV